MRLFKTIKIVDEQVADICKKHGVRLYQYANVGNHLHLLIKIPGREAWAAFIRELSGRIAQIVRGLTGIQGDFWTQRQFGRDGLTLPNPIQVPNKRIPLSVKHLLRAPNFPQNFVERVGLKKTLDLI